MAWNDVHDENTDWSAKAFLDEFWTAWHERETVAALIAMPGSPLLPADGAEVQRATSTAPTLTSSAFSWTYLQGRLETICTSYVDKALAAGDITMAASIMYTLATWRTEAGIHASGFRRRRPREITSTSALTDTQGNARATGQKAYLNSEGVYEFNGTAWVSSTGGPDTLDSDSAAPNHVPHGVMSAGDYIGWWIFNEVRDGINALHWTRIDFSRTQLESEVGGRNMTRVATWADAKTFAEARWDEVGMNGTLLAAYSNGSQNGTFGSTQYAALIHGGRAKYQATGIPTHYAKSVELYFGAHKPSGTNVTWSTNGDDVVEDLYHLQETFALAAADTATAESDWVGHTPLTKPAWVAQPAFNSELSEGWIADGVGSFYTTPVLGIVKWTFAYTA